jgi:hypothetical protein
MTHPALFSPEGRKKIAQLCVWGNSRQGLMHRDQIERRVEVILERIAEEWERERLNPDQDTVREVHLKSGVVGEAE